MKEKNRKQNAKSNRTLKREQARWWEQSTPPLGNSKKNMYSLIIPKEQLTDLWRLREYAAKGPIARQVREAITTYLKVQENTIGCPISDIEEAIERHKELNC